MSSRKGQEKGQAKKQSRRAVISAATAGALVPMLAKGAMAQMMMGGREGTRVVVDLGGAKLPRELAEECESQIRRAVLSAVARAYPRQKFGDRPLGPGTIGIILLPPEEFRP